MDRYRASTACPRCAVRDVVDVWPLLEAKPAGTYSLAGGQAKVAAFTVWRYECTSCGATGPADPKVCDDELCPLSPEPHIRQPGCPGH